MAVESLAELKSIISEQLLKFGRVNEEDTPEEKDSPRLGIASPAAASALQDDVADEIVDRLKAEKDKSSPGDSALDADAARTLPLGARTKPRGVFEDDWGARPSDERPWPVILVHGTCDTKGVWQIMSNILRQDGWAVFAPDYGHRATQTIPESSQQLGAYIDTVLAVTGAEKVILVGHSQGGLLARYWMRMDGGAEKVIHLMSISAPNHGTTHGGIASRLIRTQRQEAVVRSIIDGWFGPAGMDQVVGSEVLRDVNRDGDLESGVSYTCIATRSDAVVVPPETCFLDPEGAPEGAVRNIYIQDFDRHAVVMHEDMPMDKRVHAIVRTLLRMVEHTPR